MQQRSSDREQGERLESSRDISWKKDLNFYFFATIISYGLFLGGTKWADAWIDWWKNHPSIAQTAPGNSPSQTLSAHQQMTAAQIAYQTKQHLIQTFTLSAQFHPHQQGRDHARRTLKTLGVDLPAPTPEPIAFAGGKG